MGKHRAEVRFITKSDYSNLLSVEGIMKYGMRNQPSSDCYRVVVEYVPEEKQYFWWFNGQHSNGWTDDGPDAVYTVQQIPYGKGHYYEETFRVYATLSDRDQKLKELRRAIRVANGEAVSSDGN